jgi:hypothetical protein
VRIVLKAVSTETATPITGNTGRSGASFLDILLNGVGVGVQGTPAASAQKQSSSQANPSDRSNTDDETPHTATFAAEVSASAPTDSSAAVQKVPEAQPEASDDSQTTNSTAAEAPVSSGEPSPAQSAVLWFKQSANTLTTAVASILPASGVQRTQTSVKSSSAASQSLRGKPAMSAKATGESQTSPQVVSAGSMPIQLTTDQLSASSAMLGGKVTGPEPSGSLSASQSDGQNAHGVQGSSQHESAAVMESALSLTSTLPGSVLDAVQGVPLTSAEDSTTGSNNAPQDSSSNAQVSNPGLVWEANASPVNTFLSTALPSSSSGLIQSASKSIQFKTSSSTFGSNPSISNATTSASSTPITSGTTKNNAPEATGQNAQNSGDGTPRSQLEALQVASATGKDGQSVASQTILFGPPVPAHETTPAHSASASAEAGGRPTTEPSHLTADTGSLSAAATSSAINSARVIQSMSETEMRVGMRSSEFGDISIRTMVSEQQVQAQISVDHGELSSAISAHIPSIQAKFGSDLGLHATIEVNQSGMSFSGERGQSAPREQRNSVSSIQTNSSSSPGENESIGMRPVPIAVDSSRLDIRA